MAFKIIVRNYVLLHSSAQNHVNFRSIGARSENLCREFNKINKGVAQIKIVNIHLLDISLIICSSFLSFLFLFFIFTFNTIFCCC